MDNESNYIGIAVAAVILLFYVGFFIILCRRFFEPTETQRLLLS